MVYSQFKPTQINPPHFVTPIRTPKFIPTPTPMFTKVYPQT